MRKTAMVAIVAIVGAALAGCTEAEQQEVVEPVVREVIESLLAPITTPKDDKQSWVLD